MEYRKDCDCKATSTSGMTRLQIIEGAPAAATIDYAAIFYPGPSCDHCGRPWVRVYPATAIRTDPYVRSI